MDRLAMDIAWAAVPEDAWVVLHHLEDSRPDCDPRFGYWAEIGHKREWRTGPCEGRSAADALYAAALKAREIAGWHSKPLLRLPPAGGADGHSGLPTGSRHRGRRSGRDRAAAG